MTVKSNGKTIRTSGKKSNFKKAIVTLHPDSKIDFIRGEDAT
jgi:ribosomal protein L23